MQIISRFSGLNSDFRAWLAARMYPNVVSLADYRKKKKATLRVANHKFHKPIIA